MRIDADEAMILNSAERVPFVVFVEVVRGGELRVLKKSKQLTRQRSEVGQVLAKARTIHSPLPRYPPEEDIDDKDQQGESAPEDTFVEKMHMAAIMLAQLAHQSAQPGADINAINAIKRHESLLKWKSLRGNASLEPFKVDPSRLVAKRLRVLETPPGIQRSVNDPSGTC